MKKTAHVYPDPNVAPAIEWLVALDMLLLYIVRWPWMTLRMRGDKNHNYHEISPRAQNWFAALCATGVFLELNVLLELTAGPIMSGSVHWVSAITSAVLFTACTVIRFLIWMTIALNKLE